MAKKFLLVLIMGITACLYASAQNPSTPKFKPPKVYAQLGSYKDSVVLSVEEAKNLIDKKLVFKDEKGNSYKIGRYLFLYKKLVTVEREDGSVGANSSLVAQVFQDSPLPDLWVRTIQTDLKKGEQLIFTDIILVAPGGQAFYAKPLKIIVLK